MKQLTCEMCGSTDLVKQDGFFVCQTCGCKYSTEEAKKMMVEGTVEVQGTVKVDRTSETSSLIKRAYSFLEERKYEEVKKYCEKILDIDAECAEAYLIQMLVDFSFTKIEDLKSLLVPFDCHPLYEKIIKFADEGLKKILLEYLEDINDIIKNGLPKNVYNFLIPDNLKSHLKNLIIPYGVKAIRNHALEGCNSLESVVIPNSVMTIGESAFRDCDELTSITIPDSVTCIYSHAFEGCSSLTSIVIPDGVTSIGDNAFKCCSSLTSIVIPDSVTSIGNYAFYYCTSLTSIVIPDSVTSIGDHAFDDCSSLTSVVIGDSVTSIGDYAFWDCALRRVTLGKGVKKIGSSAFLPDHNDKKKKRKVFYTGSIEEWLNIDFLSEHSNPLCCGSSLFIKNNLVCDLVIPEGINEIPNCAFFGCSSIKSVTIPDSVTNIGECAFIDCVNLVGNEYDNALYLGNDTNPYLFLFRAKSTSITSCEMHSQTKIVCSCGFYDCNCLESLTFSNSVIGVTTDHDFTDCPKLKRITIPESVLNCIKNNNQYNRTLSHFDIQRGLDIKADGGCYVATCVYGSYDCPQVWTLRRFRDDTLGATWYGRAFIKLYYAISPTLVKWFGKTKWFKKMWKGTLDRMVEKLQNEGVESTPYDDKVW